MSTTVSALPHQNEIECDRGLHALLSAMEVDSSLFLPDRLHERLVALDDLDAGFGGFNQNNIMDSTNSQLHQRVMALRTRLETANRELSSVITLNPAIRYQFKTGQRDWPKT